MAKPVVVVKNTSFSTRLSRKPTAISKLFTANDPSGNPIFDYTFYNSKGAGYFTYNGAIYDGVTLNVKAVDLDKVSYIPVGPLGSIKSNDILDLANLAGDFGKNMLDVFNKGLSEVIQIGASDGIVQSDLATATFTTRANWSPRVTIFPKSFNFNQAGKPQAIDRLFQVTDLDREPSTYYRFIDSTSSPNSGYFTYKDQSYQGKTLQLSIADASSVLFVPGKPGTSDNISIIASDGTSESDQKFQIWQTLPNRKPVTTVNNQIFNKSAAKTAIPVRNLFTVQDGDSDPIISYDFSDENPDPDSGYFLFKDVSFQGQKLLGIKSSDLNLVNYVAGKPGKANDILIAGNDGIDTGNWSKASWSTKANIRPVSTIVSRSFAPGSAGDSVQIDGCLTNNDADGDSINSYTLKNSSSAPDTGYFIYNGISYQGKDLSIPAADLAKVCYVVGKPGSKEQITVISNDGYDNSDPATSTWETSIPVTNYTKSIDLSINREFSVSEILKVKQENSVDLFLGPDSKFDSLNFQKELGGGDFKAGVNGSTGSNRFKCGLSLNAGYGLGSFRLAGGASPRLDYNSQTGLKLTGGFIEPKMSLTLPYAYLKINALAQASFNPSLNAYYQLPWWLGGFSGNYNVPLPSVNIDTSIPLLNLDTRSNGTSQTLNLGNIFSTSINLPSFNIPNKLSAIPSSITTQPVWSQGVGSGIAYGISGDTNLLDFSLSATQIASYFGLPLNFDFNLFNGLVSGAVNLLDAKINAKSNLSYSANVAVKPNIFMTVEGSNNRYEIKDGLRINASSISDLNNDRKISISVVADPIIAASANVKVKSSLSASVDALKASAKADIAGYHGEFSVGPLYQSGNMNLGDIGNFTLFDQSAAYKMSDFLPDWQKNLRYTLDIPLA